MQWRDRVVNPCSILVFVSLYVYVFPESGRFPFLYGTHLRSKPLVYGQLWLPFIPLPPAEILTFVKLHVAFLIDSYLSSVHSIVRVGTEIADLCVTDPSLTLTVSLPQYRRTQNYQIDYSNCIIEQIRHPHMALHGGRIQVDVDASILNMPAR